VVENRSSDVQGGEIANSLKLSKLTPK